MTAVPCRCGKGPAALEGVARRLSSQRCIPGHSDYPALKGDSYRLRDKDLGAPGAAEPAEIG